MEARSSFLRTISMPIPITYNTPANNDNFNEGHDHFDDGFLNSTFGFDELLHTAPHGLNDVVGDEIGLIGLPIENNLKLNSTKKVAKSKLDYVEAPSSVRRSARGKGVKDTKSNVGKGNKNGANYNGANSNGNISATGVKNGSGTVRKTNRAGKGAKDNGFKIEQEFTKEKFIVPDPFDSTRSAFSNVSFDGHAEILAHDSVSKSASGNFGSVTSEGSISDEKKLDRLERNREIARKCRKRKRERTNALQDEVNKLREINKNLEIQLQICQSKLGKATCGRGNRGVEEENRRLSEVKRMMDMIAHRCSNDDLKARLKDYTDMYADFGEERSKVVKTHFGQLEKLLFPTQVSKMLLWILEQDDDFYSSKDPTSIWNTLCSELELDSKQKQLFLKQRSQLGTQNHSFKNILKKLKVLEQEIGSNMQTRKVQFEDITKLINPTQQAKFLNWVEGNQACIHLLDNLWQQRTQSLTSPGDENMDENDFEVNVAGDVAGRDKVKKDRKENIK